MQKKLSKIFSVLIALLMIFSAVPIQTFAVAKNSPWESTNVNSNVFLEALKYTGYDISQFTANGKYGSSVSSSYLSGIGYNTAGATGLETKNGKPDISTFESKGLCCASYATYVYFNYLPNIADVDTSFLTRPSNPRSTTSWHDACEKWVSSGNAKKITLNISTAPGSSGLSKLKDVPLGAVLIFKNSSGYQHTGIYAGMKNGHYFQTNVGNSRGPEVNLIDGFQKSGYLTVEAAYTPVYEVIPPTGYVGVKKIDDVGNAVSGAKIGVYRDSTCKNLLTTLTTDSSGNAKYNVALEEGTTVYFKETTAPTGYDISTQVVSATVVADKTTYASTNIIDNRQGKITVTKYDDNDDILGSGYVFGVYSDSACTKQVTTMTTNASGVATTGYLSAGTYYVKEKSLPATDTTHELNSTVYTVNVTKGATVKVNGGKIVNNTIKARLAVQKNAEDDVVEGLTFRLHGTSDLGKAVDMTATTNFTGQAYFKDIPVGTYIVEEVNTPDRYVVPEAQTITVTSKATQFLNFENVLKKGAIELTKVDAEYPDNKLSGAEFTVTIKKDGKTTTEKMTEVSKGVYRLENIAYGSECSVRETSAPTGFVISDEIFNVKITEEKTYTVKSSGFDAVINQPIKGTLKILKVDSFDKTPLEGVGYRLYNSNGDQIAEGYTNKNGELFFEGLRYGDYSYQEFKAPEGFILDETVYSFSVTTDGQIIYAQRENKAIEGSILIHKTDINGNVLSDVSFLLEYSVDGGKTYQPVFSRNADDTVSVGSCTSAGLQNGILVTDENGEAGFIGLRISTQTGKIIYRVKETKTQVGYQLLTDYAFEGELTENGDIDIEFTVVNAPIFVLPATGGTGFMFYISIGLTLALVAVWLGVKAVKTNKRKINDERN